MRLFILVYLVNYYKTMQVDMEIEMYRYRNSKEQFTTEKFSAS